MVLADMKLGPSRRGSAVLPTMIALMIMAGVGFALAGQRTSHAPEHAVRDGDRGGGLHGGDGHGGGPGGSGSSEAPRGTSTGVSEACAAAVSTGEGAVEAETGLTHAIDVLLANCGRNPQAQGLVNALQRLRDNQDRHEGGAQGNAGGSSADHANGSSPAHESDGHGGSQDPATHPGRGEDHRSGRADPGGSSGGGPQG
jgi:hypothetical protein